MKKLIFLILLFPQILLSQTHFYPPGARISDHTLSKFITELTLATGKKDKEFILKHLSPDILNSFGGNGGIEEFKSMWKFNNPDSDFWKVLERILLLGGSTYEEGSGRYSIPYTFTDWEKKVGNYDVFEYSLISGTQVNIRNKPTTKDSKVIGQLNYDVVKVDYDKSYDKNVEQQKLGENYSNGPYWYYVCNAKNTLCGYVYWKYVVSPIGYRMGFEERNGKWIITYFVAGD